MSAAAAAEGRALAPSWIAPDRAVEFADLRDSDRALLTAEVLARWTAGLADDEYALADVVRLERGRQQSLETIRDGIELTDQEFRFVRLLQRHEGRTVRFDEFIRYLWPRDARSASRGEIWSRHGTFARHRDHVRRLASTVRRKLEIDPLRPQHLVSMRSVGYRWYSAPPSRHDGEDYGARAEDARAARYDIRILMGGLPPPRDVEGRFTLGPEHPDRQAIEGNVTERRSQRGRGESTP